MEYDPEQIELLIQKVAFTHGSRLEDLFYQQKNILENHLNQLIIDHQGEAESITPEEIEGHTKLRQYMLVIQVIFMEWCLTVKN